MDKISFRVMVSVFALVALLPFSTSQLQAQPPIAEANAELDGLAKQLAILLAEPGFRGYLRSEIAKSKNRENILDLDKFLDRANRRQGAPRGLGKYKDHARGVSGRIKNSNLNALEGLDLYIPVDAHRAQWKGGKNFLVAVAPLGDEKDIKQIIAYSVKTGERVMLDPNQAPQQTVLVIVPEEHDSHEVAEGDVIQGEPMDPRKLPPPDVTGKEPPHKPVKQEQGNSYVGIHRLYIRDVKEPWWKGGPEIRLHFGQRKGNYCVDSTVYTNSPYLTKVNFKNNWYTTWYPPSSGECTRRYYKYDNPTAACWYFDYDYDERVVLYIYEQDGGSDRNKLYALYPETTCSWRIYSGDDYIDHSAMYSTNYKFDEDHHQNMGNASVYWRKVH